MAALLLKRWITAGPYPGLAPQTWSVRDWSERTFGHCVSPSPVATAAIRPASIANRSRATHPPPYEGKTSELVNIYAVHMLRALGEGRVPGNRLPRNRWVGRVKQAGKGGRVRKHPRSASPALEEKLLSLREKETSKLWRSIVKMRYPRLRYSRSKASVSH
jgi:hypothetical protein